MPIIQRLSPDKYLASVSAARARLRDPEVRDSHAELSARSLLAAQAFRSEYVLAESASEAAAVAKLERAAELSPFQFAVLGAYRPLARRSPVSAPPGSALELLIRVQITEPLAEAALRPGIRAL